MANSRNLEYKDIVINLYATKSAKDYIERCDAVIAWELARAQKSGWEPCIPTSFDYLEKNGHVKIHNEGGGKIPVVSIIGFLLALLFKSDTDAISDSVTIPLHREVQR